MKGGLLFDKVNDWLMAGVVFLMVEPYIHNSWESPTMLAYAGLVLVKLHLPEEHWLNYEVRVVWRETRKVLRKVGLGVLVLVVLVSSFVGCKKETPQEIGAGLFGYEETCVDGVMYLHSRYGITVKYTPEGKVWGCK